MSLALQSGFAWPSGAFSAPLASLPAVSFASSANSSSITTVASRQPSMLVPLISTPSYAARSTSVFPVNSSITALLSGTESLGQRTTHVTVTATVAVTPSADAKVQEVVISLTEASHETSSAQTIRVFTKRPAPDTTGVVFKLYRPDSEKPATSSVGSKGTKTKVILGTILGPICLVVVILILIAMWRGRGRTNGKQSKVKERKHHHLERSTNDMINEAHRRRRERNRRGRERDIELNAVQCIEMTDTQVSPLRNDMVRAHLPDDRGYDDVSPLSSPTGLWGHVQPR
jgi:hypothetical protein